MARNLLKRKTRRIDEDAWEVTDFYSCPNSEVDTHKAQLWPFIPPGYSGRSAPVAQVVDHEVDFFARTNARIVAQFRTLTNEEYMARYPNKVLLSVGAASRGERVRVDRAGKVISGPDDADASGRYHWRIVEGSNIIQRPLMVLRFHGYVDGFFTGVGSFWDELGKINSNIFVNTTPTIGSKELLFLRIASRPYRFNRQIQIVDYDFLWNPGGKFGRGIEWNESTIAQKFETIVAIVDEYDVNGAKTGNTHAVRSERVLDITRLAELYEDTSFASLDSWLDWD